jgi:hypothetical protein
MTAEFDPYHKLLGISPREQPPTFYRLLGVAVFEDDPEVIEASANRQMSYVQEMASGPHVEAVQRLLNELALARVCLLDVKKKNVYDSQLREQQDAEATVNQMMETTVLSAPPVQTPPAAYTVPKPPPAPALPRIATTPPPAPNSALASQATLRQRRTSSSKIIAAALTGLVCLGLVAITAVAITAGRSGDEDQFVQPKQPTAADIRAELAAGTSTSPADERRVRTTQYSPHPVRTDATSDIPAPGAYAKDTPRPAQHAEDFVPAQPRPVPNHAEPNHAVPNQVEPQQQMPPQLKAAMAALDENDLPRMITHLETYLGGEPRPPWLVTAKQILEQARFVASDERVLAFLDNELKKLTDDQLLAVANGEANLDYEARRFSNPRLQNAFRRAVERNLPEAILRRLE